MTALNTTETVDARKIGVMIESKLIEWNIPYEYFPEFPIDDIKTIETTQIRSADHRVSQEQAERYAGQMANGAVFPPIVLTNFDVLLDGNTRTQAYKRIKAKTVPAFKATFPNMMLARAFAGAVNQQNGRPLSREEVQTAALDLMRFQYTDEAIARELGYSRTQINNWRREQECAERAQRTLVTDRLERVKKADQWKLSQVALDAPFAAAVELVADVKPGARELSALVKELKDAPSEAEQLQIIAQRRGELLPSGPPPHHHVPVADELRNARMVLPRLVKLRGAAGLLVENDPERRGPWVESWRSVRDLANEVLGQHGA